MKKTICTLILFLAVCLAATVITASASSTTDEFCAAVALIDSEANYATRSERAAAALTIYNGLDDAEKAEVTAEAEMLAAEMDAIADIEQRADAFINAVENLSAISLIKERQTSIEIIYGDMYFDDESYPGITEALALLAETKVATEQTISDCVAFMSAVERVALANEEWDYVELRAALDEAALYYNTVDNSYDGITVSKTTYSKISSEITKRETFTDGFLETAEIAIGGVGYAVKKQAYNDAMKYTAYEDFIPEREGVEEALAALAELESYFRACDREAAKFVLAVGEARSASLAEYRAKLIACYGYLETVDLTVPAAEQANIEFTALVRAYNAVVALANETFA
ncbi:MAG: hypothetical protein IJX38_05565 [Clostridia bacterium]|nr:hypothetical protein [Clostridia bacterium]